MFELAIVIIIVAVLMNKKKQKNINNGGMGTGRRSMPDMTVTTARTGKVYTGEAGRVRQNPQTARQTAVKSAIDEAREDGNSTTAYLMEKAEQDAREHEREKYEEQMRLNRSRGNFCVAERLCEGDMVPQNRQCVICGYCGAQNLLPLNATAGYSCYFCREPL